MTRGERNIAWIERCCRIPEGKGVGEAVRLRGWQRDELRKLYDGGGCRRRTRLARALLPDDSDDHYYSVSSVEGGRRE